MTGVQKLLREFGQILELMNTAPRDGRTVLAYSEHFGLVAVKWIDEGLPKWVEASENGRGFLDWAFTGWLDPLAFRPLGEQELTELLVAYVDDSRAQKRDDILKILDPPIIPNDSNNTPALEKGLLLWPSGSAISAAVESATVVRKRSQ
jgi:hypothetical protein